MIDIILVKNIFDDHPKTEVQSKDYIAGMTLAGYVDMRDKDAYVGGMWVRDPKIFYVKDGMQLLILPHVAGGGFKKILGTVLMVGLMIAAPAMFVGWSSLALRALASGAVMILGGKIINSIFHLNQAASRGIDDQSSPTYGWELPNVQTQEGGVIGETFGECIPAPQLLMYHVETTNSDDQDKNNQYLNVLYCGGYGPVESIDDIRIGHTPIENFSDVQIETRKGTNNQSPIPFFGSTVADQFVDMTLAENKPVVRSTDMENCNRIDVTVSWPSGLYHMNDDGNYEGCTARFRIEYRKTGTSDWRGGNMYEAHSSSSLISNVTAGAKADRDEVWTIARQDTTTRVKVRTHYRTETTWKWVIRSNKRSEVFDLPALKKGDRYDNGYIAFTRELVFSFLDGFSLDGVQIYVQKCDYYITKATNSGVRRSYAIKGLEPARYDVRVTALSLPHTSRDCSFMQWNTLSSFADDSAYSRPNKVLVALRIKATNQLNGGVPDINWRQRRTIGYVWNPETQAYEQVDLRNPVWAAYDILHHCRKLFNVNTQTEEYHVDGCPKERFTQYWDQWQAAADYADEDVKNADGSTEPRFRFDAYYGTSLRRYEAANKALAVAHATLVRHGLQLGVVVDKPGVIHQVFGEGRTLISSVKGEFSATEDRAHSLHVTYNDTQNDFKNTEFFIRSDAYASAEANGQDNTAQLSLFGVSSRTQAYREAVYALATNERQLQAIQFSADVNAFVCEYGDLIGVNSQVPRIGVASGRIVSVSGTTVKLDKTVTFTKGEAYTVMFQLSTNDALISREVTAFTADTTTDTVTVTAAFDDGAVPVALDNYVLGIKDKAAKPFRITKIERDGDQKVSI
uniref:TipJ family phage tail tip protein n=1 Tax=Megasphaera sp. TaxID=2023260 RepID=UPI004025117A